MWAFGLQELQPSFPPPLWKDQVHPAVHSKQFIRGMTHPPRLIPAAGCASSLLYLDITKTGLERARFLL